MQDEMRRRLKDILSGARYMRRSARIQRENPHAGVSSPAHHTSSVLQTPIKHAAHNGTPTSPVWKTPSESDKYNSNRPLVYYEGSADVHAHAFKHNQSSSSDTHHQDSYAHLSSSNSAGNNSSRGGPFSSTSSMLTSHLSSSSTHSLHASSIPAHTSPPLSFLHAHTHYSSSSSMDDRIFPSEHTRAHANNNSTWGPQSQSQSQSQSHAAALRGDKTFVKSPLFVNSQMSEDGNSDGNHVDATAVDMHERRTPHHAVDDCEIFESDAEAGSVNISHRAPAAPHGHHSNISHAHAASNGRYAGQNSADNGRSNGHYTGPNRSSNGAPTSARLGRSSGANSKRAPKSLPPALTVIEDGYGGADEEIFSPQGTERVYVPDAAGVGIHSSGGEHRDDDDVAVHIASLDDVCVNIAPSTPSQVGSCFCMLSSPLSLTLSLCTLRVRTNVGA
jgi:hypothetical protein